jgi:hypothetical protein
MNSNIGVGRAKQRGSRCKKNLLDVPLIYIEEGWSYLVENLSNT